MRRPQISVVIPVFNNAESLVELNRRLADHFNHNGLSFEVIVVNDASKDQSMEVIQNICELDGNVRPIFLTKNVGQHEAILKGLEIAQGEHIVVMDADLQDQPELIADMHQLVNGDDEAVFIIRKGIYQSKARMFTSFIMKSIVRVFTGLHHKAGSYFLIPRALLATIIELGQSCRYAYMSIAAGSCATHLKYIKAHREKSISQSGYTFTKRITAAHKAIYCAIYCRIELSRKSSK
ncbi:glycosyltransferase [Reichenbachiella sp.]|uniref:glycosyltransferase n=1 Tax=Reichenbachiella sp. TaxID=2184521 RepID=UPI003BAFDD5E